MGSTYEENSIPDFDRMEAALDGGNRAEVRAIFEEYRDLFAQLREERDAARLELKAIKAGRRRRGSRRDGKLKPDAIAENSPDGILRLDRSIRLVYANPAAARMMHRSPAELLGKTPVELPMPLHLASLWEGGVQRVLENGRGETFEYEFDDHRTIHHLQITMTPEFGSDGAVESVLALTRDISEQKKTVVALRESEERFRLALKASPIIVYAQDGTLRYTWVYSSHPEFTAEMFLGRTDRDLYTAEEANRLIAVKSRIMETGEPEHDEFEVTTARGKRWLEITIAPLRNNEGQIIGITGASLDITARILADSALQHSHEQFRILSEANALLLNGDQPEHMIQIIATRVMDHLGCDVFFNYIPDNARGYLRLNAFAGIPEEKAREIAQLEYGSAICGCVARDRSRIISENVQENCDIRADLVRSMGIQAYACHPLLIGEGAIGTLSFGTRSRTSFTENELELMRTVADRISGAIQRKKAEDRLRESEQKYSAIFEKSPSAIALTRMPEGIVVDVNDAFLDMFGITRGEALGRTSDELGVTAPESREQIAAMMEAGVPVRFFEYTRTTSGTQRVLLLDLDRVIIDGVSHFLATIRDITERKRVEEEYARQSELLHGIIDHIPVLLTIWDNRLRHFHFNEKLRSTLGWTEADADAGNFMEKVYPDPEYRREVEKFMISLEPGFRDLKTTARDGNQIDIAWANVHLNGDIAIGIGVDIRGRKRTERALRESEERYRMLFESMTEGFVLGQIIYDHHGKAVDYRFLEANPAYEALTGISREESLRKTIRQLIPTLEPQWIEEHARVAETGEPNHWRSSNAQTGRSYEMYSYRPKPGLFASIFTDITEHQQAEEELSRSNERLRLLLDTLPVGVTIAEDPKCRVIVTNPAGARMFEIPEDGNVSASAHTPPPHRYFHQDRELRPEEMPLQLAVFENREITNMEIKALLSSGRQWTGLVNATPMRGRDGNIIGGIAVIRDITERKKAEEAFARSSRKTAEILDSIQDGFFSLDREWRFTYVNRRAAGHIGCRPEELIGQCLWEKSPGVLGTAHELHYRKAMSEGSARQFELKDALADQWYSIRVYPSVDGISVFWQDITERRLVDEALRESEERFRAAFENGAVAMVLASIEGRILKANAAFCALTGYSESEIAGRSFTELTHPDDREQNLDSLKAVALGRETGFRTEKRYIHRDGRIIWADLSTRVVHDAAGEPQYVLTYIQDITERRETEGALRDACEQIKTQADELQAANEELQEQTEELQAQSDELRAQSEELQAAYDELQKAHDELEARIRERTAELNATTEELRIERQRLVDVLDMLPLYVILLSSDYHVPFANRFFRERFGGSHGLRCFEYLFNRTEACENCESFKALKNLAPHRWEWLGPDSRNYDIYDFPFTGSDGSTLILEMGLDITERKQNEAELEKYRHHLEELVSQRTGELEAANEHLLEEISERMAVEHTLRETRDYFDKLLGYANAPVIVWNPDMRITLFNRASEKFTGYFAEEVIGCDLSMLFPPESKEETLERIARTAGGEYWETVEISILRKDGEVRIALWNSANVCALDGVTLVATIAQGQDITERKASEVRIAQLHREQEAFLRHEVKNLFAPIQLFAELTLDSDNLTGEQIHYLGRIVETARRAAGFIDSLKRIHDIDTGKYPLKLIPQPLGAVLGHVIQNLAPLAEKNGVTVLFRAPEKEDSIPLDPQLLPGVFNNLIQNAIEHVADLCDPAEKVVTVELRKGADRSIVRINNRGTPVSPERLTTFFEKFNSGPEKKGGTGLGTTYSWSVVRAHGGNIAVTSDADEGTTVTVELPG